MEEIKIIGGEDYPDISKYPQKDDFWNANIENITELDHVYVASCVSPAMGIRNINSIILLKPGTTQRDILNDWQQIKKFRENLDNAFGNFNKPELSYHQTAYRLHRDFDMSYGELKKFLNFQILTYLCLGFDIVQETGSKETEIWIQVFEKYLVSFGNTIDDAKEYV